MHRPPPTALALLLLVALSTLGPLACSGGGGTTGAPASSGSSSGSSGAEPPAEGPSRCVGDAVEAYTIRDPQSCRKQDSEWRSSDGKCSGTTFVASCARMDQSGVPEEAVRARCLDVPGCDFTEADGSVTRPSGHCEGTKTPCSELDEGTCGTQPGCIYYSSGGCTDKNGLYYLDNASCADLQISDVVSFSVVRSACEQAVGCTWVP